MSKAISVHGYKRTQWLRWLAALAVATSSLWVTPAAVAKDHHDEVLPQCQELQVPVSLTQPAVTGTLYGELCVPAHGTPSAVQLLVHGATYNRYYSDWPYRPDSYSYVRKMTKAGYATFNVERLGYGRSTHPASTSVTVQNGADAMHQVVGMLRSGAIGGHAFSRVIWVGHSLGTLYAWLEAAAYPSDQADGYVLTGLIHSLKASWLTLAFADAYAANADPAFATLGFDDGYLTFLPGTRAALFYWTPTAEPYVIDLDERLKDTVSATEFLAAYPMFDFPPQQSAPSHAISVPTLIVLGEHDRVFCDEDGLVCNRENVFHEEKPYYSVRFEVLIAPETGHDLQLHLTAPATGDEILHWLFKEKLGP